MIKFFRKIRYDLMETGKTTKYFKYAIGEIILVVIGILIALSINNWNTNKQQEKELNDYLIKISENVSEDLKVATDFLKRRNDNRKISRDLLNSIFEEKDITLKETVNMFDIFQDFEFVSRKGGFTSLTNSGYIGKLKRSRLDSLLFQYYFNVDALIRQEESLTEFMEAMEIEWNSNENLLPITKSYLTNTSTNMTTKGIKAIFSNKAMQSALSRSAFQNTVIRQYDSLIITGNLLKEEIETRVKY